MARAVCRLTVRAAACAHHVHAVDVPLRVADEERATVEFCAGLTQARVERGAHQAAAQSDGELPAFGIALQAYLQRVEVHRLLTGGEHPVMLDARVALERKQGRGIAQRR